MKEKLILLVEDNPDDAELTLVAFRKCHLANRVVVAQDGVEALEYLLGTPGQPEDELPPLPEVVLLDLKLPRIDGLEVLRRIRESPRTRMLPVVVLTSSNDSPDLRRSYELGANSFVRKPVEFVDFVQAARQLGLFWMVINESPPPPPRAAL